MICDLPAAHENRKSDEGSCSAAACWLLLLLLLLLRGNASHAVTAAAAYVRLRSFGSAAVPRSHSSLLVGTAAVARKREKGRGLGTEQQNFVLGSNKHEDCGQLHLCAHLAGPWAWSS